MDTDDAIAAAASETLESWGLTEKLGISSMPKTVLEGEGSSPSRRLRTRDWISKPAGEAVIGTEKEMVPCWVGGGGGGG